MSTDHTTRPVGHLQLVTTPAPLTEAETEALLAEIDALWDAANHANIDDEEAPPCPPPGR